MVTNIDVKSANTPDTDFVQPSIEATIQVTGQEVETVYADGAYQSPENDSFCEGIDMVFTGMQGPRSRYQLELEPDGLHVTDMATGQTQIASPVAKRKNSKKDKWYIQTENGKKYFGPNQNRASQMRKKMPDRPVEESRKRNNVEATIFHFGYTLHNKKNKIPGYVQATNVGQLQRPVDKSYQDNQIYTTNMSKNVSKFKKSGQFSFFQAYFCDHEAL